MKACSLSESFQRNVLWTIPIPPTKSTTVVRQELHSNSFGDTTIRKGEKGFELTLKIHTLQVLESRAKTILLRAFPPTKAWSQSAEAEPHQPADMKDTLFSYAPSPSISVIRFPIKGNDRLHNVSQFSKTCLCCNFHFLTNILWCQKGQNFLSGFLYA